MDRLLLATNNPGKVRELRRLLAGCGYEIVTPNDLGIALEVDETGSTYAENAALKAKAFAEAGGCLALADDSGIEVDALAGGPGVYSARYGGPGLDDAGRTSLLLKELESAPDALRTARYRAVIAIAAPTPDRGPDEPVDSPAVQIFEGIQEGCVTRAERGDGGFGYDPVFVPTDMNPGRRTQAEIGAEEKDKISHRGKAAALALEWLREATP